MKTALPLPALRTPRSSDSHASLPIYRPGRCAPSIGTIPAGTRGRAGGPSFLQALLRSLSAWSA
jgi:hypothetical protein